MNDLLKNLLVEIEEQSYKQPLEPAPEGVAYSWSNGGWKNGWGGWVNGGWNNSWGSWQNHGWSNSSSWVNHGWNNSRSWTNGGWSNGGCFLTTACVDYQHLPDNCYELEVLRKVRDQMLAQGGEMKDMVAEYYRIAPQIIANINRSPECSEVWEDLYKNLVLYCVDLYEQDRIEDCIKHYVKVVSQLKEKYPGNIQIAV